MAKQNTVARRTWSAWVVACAFMISWVHAARAEVCDGGLASCSDAGGDDAGSDDAGAELMSGADAAWPDGPPGACSCTSEFAPDSNGDLHVCTGSLDEKTCESFTCEEGKRAAVACSEDDVTLCCEMKSRKLYSQLYGDCTHPRCEIGFRAQCEDFGGKIHNGPCQVPEEYLTDDEGDSDGGGLCSTAAGRQQTKLPAWSLLGAALLLVVTRRRR